ncbi:MAG: UvrD-helicase domain-containing protein [Leptonema sp. (in: bacteria)]
MELKEQNFSESQWKIITSKDFYKQIIASAGSGKTRTVIGYTLFNLEYKKIKNKILLLSFSKKACGELRHRLPFEYSKHVEIRTFHAFCYHYIKNFHPLYKITKFSILEEEKKLEFVKQLLLKHPEKTLGIPYVILMNHLKKLEVYLPELHQMINSELKKFKQENHLLEYEDLISMVIEGLVNRSTWIYPMLENYKHIIVDEFQDTDPKQLYFLKLIQPKTLLVVGDDWQAIYGFRGATVFPLLQFKKYFENAKIFKLTENYRSLKNIVDCGNYIISKSAQKIPKSVKAIRGKGINVPILSISKKEKNFYNLLIKILISFKVMILVRSNFKRDFWIKEGIPEEQVMTIHKSKGLEFPVILLDIESGWSGETYLTDEEIRVAYVAVTRAQNICIVLYSNQKKECLEFFLYNYFFSKISKNVNLEQLTTYLDKEQKYRNPT